VKVGEPAVPELYHQRRIDGIVVYLHKDIVYSKAALCISYRKWLLFSEIFVYDPETICLCSGGQMER
jgi:hypothetical protein